MGAELRRAHGLPGTGTCQLRGVLPTNVGGRAGALFRRADFNQSNIVVYDRRQIAAATYRWIGPIARRLMG